jgi:phage I-like protein
VTILSAPHPQPESPAPALVGTLVRARIVARLQEAVRLANDDLAANLDRVRDALQEVRDRVEAISLVASADTEPATAQPTSHLTVTALAATRGEPVGEFLLIPFGDVRVERPIAGESFHFTRAHAESAKGWFDQLGRKLAIDYEHQSFDRLNPRPDGLRPAAGWIGGLEVRDDGLWAMDVTWTDRARELLRTGEYRYFSPVIFWTDEDQLDVAALGPVALTNDPAMCGVRPLAAGRRMTDDSLSPLVSRAALEAAEAEAALLRRQLAAQEADTFVERGMRLGKILDSTSLDWRDDYLRDPAGTEERLARAPVLLPPGRMIALDRRGQAERLPRTPVGTAAAQPNPWGIESEDLAAYERATAAGRVLGGAARGGAGVETSATA